MSEKQSRADRARDRQFAGNTGAGSNVLTLPADVEAMKLTAEETTLLDIVPFPVGPEHPNYAQIKKDFDEFGDPMTFWVFPYAVHKKMNGMAPVICHYQTYGKPCPICEAKQAIMDEKGWDWDDKRLDTYGYSKRAAYLVAELNGDTDDYKVLDYPNGWLHKTLVEKAKKENVLLLDESEKGSSIALTPVEQEFKGKTMAGKCMVKFKPRKFGYTEEDMADTFNIGEFFRIDSYEDIYKMLHAIDDTAPSNADEDDQEIDDAPTSGRGRRGKASDDTPTVEDEPEVRTPNTSSRRGGRGSAPVEVVEDEPVTTGRGRGRRGSAPVDSGDDNIAF